MMMECIKDDEIELCLELSIGGSYGKRRKTATNDSNTEVSTTGRNRKFESDSGNVVDLNEPSCSHYSNLGNDNVHEGGIPSTIASASVVVTGNDFDHTRIVGRESKPQKSTTKHILDQPEIIKKPPRTPSKNATTTTYVPRVSTTGNGPNGKTIKGFLYNYIGKEVSIMCACHRNMFSPAEFVKHAGGVDVSNPLRHITVIHAKLDP